MQDRFCHQLWHQWERQVSLLVMFFIFLSCRHCLVKVSLFPWNAAVFLAWIARERVSQNWTGQSNFIDMSSTAGSLSEIYLWLKKKQQTDSRMNDCQEWSNRCLSQVLKKRKSEMIAFHDDMIPYLPTGFTFIALEITACLRSSMRCLRRRTVTAPFIPPSSSTLKRILSFTLISFLFLSMIRPLEVDPFIFSFSLSSSCEVKWQSIFIWWFSRHRMRGGIIKGRREERNMGEITGSCWFRQTIPAEIERISFDRTKWDQERRRSKRRSNREDAFRIPFTSTSFSLLSLFLPTLVFLSSFPPSSFTLCFYPLLLLIVASDGDDIFCLSFFHSVYLCLLLT